MVNPILNLGFLLMLVAQTIRNILALRIILIFAQGAFVTYAIITSNISSAVWNSLFILLNMYQSIVIIRQRRPIILPEDISDIYEDVFMEMSKREFLYFWQTGTERTFKRGVIIKEGEHQNNLLLILRGKVYVMRKRKIIAVLGRKDFIAEMSLLSGDSASANVLCREELVCMAWSRENLANLEKLNYKLWSKLQHILGKDLVGKVRRTSSRL